MSLTREFPFHAYFPLPVGQTTIPGVIKVATANNIEQTWAIARPVSAPDSGGAPYYIAQNLIPQGGLVRGGAMPLTPSQPNLEADPSNPTTWQRAYVFTQ